MENPLVSVIVITYNSAKTVLETLESVKAQTYQNIELIVSDDSSPDDTCQEVQLWIDENRERFVHAELVVADRNTGVSGNINRGVAKSHGEWIKSIAGDDLLIPTAIEEFTNFVINNQENVRMCVCDVEPFAESGGVPQTIIDSYNNYFERESEPLEQQRKRVMTSLVFVGPAYFYSRELYEEVGGYTEKYGCAEEWPFVYKIIMRGNRIHTIDKKLVRYRIQPDSLCHSREDNSLGNKRVFMGMYQHFFDYAFKDLIYDGRPLTAWHYALQYWGRRMQYHVGNARIRKLFLKFLMLLSPMAYLKKLGVGEVI